LHAFWAHTVPGRLGCNYKYERVKVWQPSPTTLIVRWTLRWQSSPFGWAPLELAQVLPMEDGASATIKQLQQRLDDAHGSLRAAAAALPDDGVGAQYVAAADSQLKAGLDIVAQLAEDVALAEAADEGGFMGDSLRQLGDELLCTASGTTTLTLDASGLLATHTDTYVVSGRSELILR
jgi:hypothetical protein